MRKQHWLAFALALACGLGPRAGWAAEPFLDLYVGAARTEDAEVGVQLLFTVPPQEASRTAEFDTSGVVGGRFGAWSGWLPWLGAALDVSAFRADSEVADLTIVPVSLLVMVRWPLLREPGLPGGRLQPYLGFGPSVVYSDAKVDLRPLVDDNVAANSFDSGWDLRAGLAWQFHRHLALFGEYRYLHFQLDYEKESAGWILGFPTETVTTVDTDIDTHQFLAGVSCRF